MQLTNVPLEQVVFDPRNPRSDATEGLEELAASMQGGVVQPPILIQDGDRYRVLVGERRVRAAKAAGLESLPCLVREPLDPLEAHRARVVENLHRRELSPIDHAAALRVSWLLANAEGLGLREQAEEILAQERPLVELLPQLEALLDEHGFTPTAPSVTWDTVLDDLGVEMTPARRKKLLRVLSMPQDVQETLRETPVTEAGMRSIAALDDEEVQRQVATAVAEDPDLAPKVRRIAHAIRSHGYSPEEALAEARGEVVQHHDPEQPSAPVYSSDQAIVDAVLALLDSINAVLDALGTLREQAPDSLDIPDPWRMYYLNALERLQEEIAL